MAATVVLVAASCGFGTDTRADRIADTSAQLSGRVVNSVDGRTSWWFEYGPTVEYGSSTPTRSVTAGPTTKPLVDQTVLGLEEATTYHYRLCARGADRNGLCSYDATFTTTSGQDSVTGFGTVLSLSGIGLVLGADLDARSGPAGEDPVGQATISPGVAYFKTADSGPVTCLRVEGNRATIGMLATPADLGQDPPPVPYHRLVFVEDNGPTGDRYGTRIVDDATTCPVPTAADFPDFVFGDVVVPPIVSGGGFVVHDHLG